MIEFDNTLGQIFRKGFWKILKEKRLNTQTVVSIQGKRTEAKIWILHRHVWLHTGANFSVNWKIVKKSWLETRAVSLDQTKKYVYEEFGNSYRSR